MENAEFSPRLREAIEAGMVVVNEAERKATIVAPPDFDQMTDDDWLAVLQAASEVGRELESLGYEVAY